MAVVAGIFLVFAVLVLLYKRIVPPFVNMGSLLLAPLGGAIALHLTGNADVDAGDDRNPDAARDRRQELDPADRLRDRGDGQGRREGRGDRRCRPQARPADRHDHGGDGRRHAADRPVALGRRQLAGADGHRRHRRTDPLDHPDPGHRPGRLQPRRQLRALARAEGREACSPMAAPRTTVRRRSSRRSECPLHRSRGTSKQWRGHGGAAFHLALNLSPLRANYPPPPELASPPHAAHGEDRSAIAAGRPAP